MMRISVNQEDMRDAHGLVPHRLCALGPQNGNKKTHPSNSDVLDGDKGIRTPDLLNAIQTRSQLRHTPRYEYYNTRPAVFLQGFFFIIDVINENFLKEHVNLPICNVKRLVTLLILVYNDYNYELYSLLMSKIQPQRDDIKE